MTMKSFTKYCLVIVLVCLVALTGQARTYRFDVTNTRGDLTRELRDKCGQAGYNDTVVLNFGSGTYTVSGTIGLKCHTVIKGAGRDLTTIMLDNGNDSQGFKSFTDDTYFRITGTLKNTISVSISDLTFRLKEHKGLWWGNKKKDVERYAVKVHHANRVEITRVNSYMQNAKITNFDLHVCSNVYVTDCVISNYNNCDIGGCVWVRGTMDNINIKHNKFYKYGKDEVVGIFDRLVDNTKGYIRGKAVRTNIFIEDNEFHYGYNGNDKDLKAYNQTSLTLQTDLAKSDDQCTTRNFHVRGNKFYMRDMTTRCMFISFDPADVHEDIYIENNQIINEPVDGDEKYYRQDIEVNDLSSCNDPIHIIGNTVRNKNLVLTPSGSQGYSFLLVQGGKVDLRGNKLVNEVVRNPKDGNITGMQFVWCGAQGGSVTMQDNVCKGLMCIAYVGAGDGTKLFTLDASNNYFEGETRVYSHKVDELRLNFTGNTFKSTSTNFFLQEFAPKGSVVFNNNDVTVTSGGGRFMTHWSNTPTSTMRFDKLEVKGNVFRGVKNEQEMFKHVTNVGKRTIRSNTFRK